MHWYILLHKSLFTLEAWGVGGISSKRMRHKGTILAGNCRQRTKNTCMLYGLGSTTFLIVSNAIGALIKRGSNTFFYMD